VYLIVEVVTKQETLPVISLIMIGAVYGLQALVFVLRRKWDMVGWMVFYILAIPIFSFMLPLYSFWRMDDFSWGATRVVLGESGKKIIVHVCVSSSWLFVTKLMVFSFFQDEGKFDPRAIPLKSWNDYVRSYFLSYADMSLIPICRKTNSGIKNRTTALVRGSHTVSSRRKDMRHLLLHRSTAARPTTSHAATHLHHPNLA